MQALACKNWQDMPCRAFSETNLNVKIGFWLALHDSKAIFLHPAGMDKNNVTVKASINNINVELRQHQKRLSKICSNMF